MPCISLSWGQSQEGSGGSLDGQSVPLVSGAVELCFDMSRVFFVFGACHGLSSVVLVTPALTAPGLTACAYSPVADSDSMQSVQGETWRNAWSFGRPLV